MEEDIAEEHISEEIQSPEADYAVEYQPREFFMIHDEQFYTDLAHEIPVSPMIDESVERPVRAFDGNDPDLDPWLRSLATVFCADWAYDITTEWLVDIVHRWSTTDDVFRPKFLATVYFNIRFRCGISIEELNRVVPEEWCTRSIKILEPDRPGNLAPVAQGPFEVIRENCLAQVYRVHPDVHQAFVIPTIRNKERGFRIPRIEPAGIPVPSRIPFGRPSNQLPLAGKRVVVSDNIELMGIRPGTGTGALELNDPSDYTAPLVWRLMQAGATVIGRTKIAPKVVSGHAWHSFAGYQAPINPRGDGLQDPSGRNAGGATACSAYGWVDIALGTNTTGDVINPAIAHGLFGFRLSSDRVNMEGFDTVSQSAHDAATVIWVLDVDKPRSQKGSFLGEGATLWYAQQSFETCWSTWYNEVSNDFAEDLKQRFKMKKSVVSIEDQFGETEGQSLAFCLSTTPTGIEAYETSHITRRLTQKYMEQIEELPVSPIMKERLQDLYEVAFRVGVQGKKIYAEARRRKEQLKDWMKSKIFTNSARLHYFQNILVTPTGFRLHRYRDNTEHNETCPKCQAFFEGAHGRSWDTILAAKSSDESILVAVLAGLPILNIPIGETEYMSHVTDDWVPVPTLTWACVGWWPTFCEVHPDGS
ncbi:amidase signature domain-containing protein [Podospora appendiculata]|uniref:Amidase signature domain-containing protein n=1 Tax=Podospora appendiculata TaxID=314037 RepID=A0AAE0X0B3_9PEZI|nr:amidase signature domain-containing protein [Podospora appendiculata]